MAKEHSTFLADEMGARKSRAHLTYMDGFRFGVGTMVAFLFITLLLGGLAWGMVALLELR